MIDGDPVCPILVSFSVSDSKPVHFLSTSTEEMVWLTKDRDVYDTGKYTEVSMQFHHTNAQSEYNYGMNKVGISDQCRSCYIMDHWKRCFKL